MLLQVVAYFYVKSMSVGEIAVKVRHLSVERNDCAGDISQLDALYVFLYKTI